MIIAFEQYAVMKDYNHKVNIAELIILLERILLQENYCKM